MRLMLMKNWEVIVKIDPPDVNRSVFFVNGLLNKHMKKKVYLPSVLQFYMLDHNKNDLVFVRFQNIFKSNIECTKHNIFHYVIIH